MEESLPPSNSITEDLLRRCYKLPQIQQQPVTDQPKPCAECGVIHNNNTVRLRRSDLDEVGQKALTKEDRALTTGFATDKVSFLFGEILPEGARRIFELLNLKQAESLYDLGSGLGKVVMQAFLELPHLKQVVGVELSKGRYALGVDAMRLLHQHYLSQSTAAESKSESAPVKLSYAQIVKNETKISASPPTLAFTTKYQLHESVTDPAYIELVQEEASGCVRSLKLICNDLTQVAQQADAIVCDTKFLYTAYPDLCKYFSTCKTGARLMMYNNLEEMYDHSNQKMPFEKLGKFEIATSWAPQDGHRFHFYKKIIL